ncbi:MAG TPA: diguanylate cyclase, partial [Acidimicrobiales bacterium]|nr:diguanylate cyclase [Acidimicrobiales bacterium]
ALRDGSQAVTAAALLRWVGLTYQLDADFDAAFDCFEAALAVSGACGDEAGVGHAMNVKAIAHFRLGQLDDAEQLYLQARDRARRAGEAKLAAMTAQNLGVIANIRGDLEQALGYYEASLADYRSLGLTKYICTTLNNLGVLYTRMERWETGERAYDEAVEISQVLGDLPTRMLLEVNRASHWIARHEYGRARDACDLAMSLSQQTQDTHALGEAHKCYGVIAREMGDPAAAEQSFHRAAKLAEQRQDLLLAAETAREMAELYRQQGRNRDTLQCLNRAHRLFSQLHARRDVADIDRQTEDLEEDFLQMVQRWGDSIESKDHYTQGHCERVADLACALAEAVGIDQKSLFWFRIGALLHDVGKLTIPPEVLNKPGRLTVDEWSLVKHHPVAGVQMLADIEFPWDVRPIVESHHERWDGGGYPHGLSAEAIPLTARILCIADVYDALTSERSYKKAVSHEQALDMMRGEVGAQFDPNLFAHFERIVDRVVPLSGRTIAPPATSEDASGADLDHLTGVPLRRAFMAQANELLTRLRPSEVPPSLLVIDVDHFKLVNDTYGHLQGDDVLRAVVHVFKRVLRSGDVIGRYGGDEFVVLLPWTPPENAREVADRLRAAVEEERCTLRDMDGATIGVTLSIGVTAAEAGAHIEALFAAADRALYDAKRAGRNAVAVAGGAAESSRPHLSLNRFVGRVQEVRKLVRLLDSSFAGQPGVVAVVGEAGVGKSTLLRQLLPEVRVRNGALVLGRCLEADVKPPYGPWAEALGAVAARVSQGGRDWRELARLVPAL